MFLRAASALLAALDAGALVVLLLTQVSQNTGLGAAALKSLKSVVQRLVFLDMDFRHSISLPPLTPFDALRAKFLA